MFSEKVVRWSIILLEVLAMCATFIGDDGTLMPVRIVFFTTLVNIMCLFFFILFSFKRFRNALSPWKGMVVTSMIFISLVHWLGVISGQERFSLRLDNIMLHGIIVAFCILYEIKFTVEAYKPYAVVIWCIPLVVYIVYIYSIIALVQYTISWREGTKYPYFFLDPGKVGVQGIVVSSFICLIGYILIGLAIVALSRARENRTTKR